MAIQPDPMDIQPVPTCLSFTEPELLGFGFGFGFIFRTRTSFGLSLVFGHTVPKPTRKPETRSEPDPNPNPIRNPYINICLLVHIYILDIIIQIIKVFHMIYVLDSQSCSLVYSNRKYETQTE